MVKYTRDIVVGEAYLRLLCIAGMAPDLIEDHPQYSATRDLSDGDLPTFSREELELEREKAEFMVEQLTLDKYFVDEPVFDEEGKVIDWTSRPPKIGDIVTVQYDWNDELDLIEPAEDRPDKGVIFHAWDDRLSGNYWTGMSSMHESVFAPTNRLTFYQVWEADDGKFKYRNYSRYFEGTVLECSFQTLCEFGKPIFGNFAKSMGVTGIKSLTRAFQKAHTLKTKTRTVLSKKALDAILRDIFVLTDEEIPQLFK